MLDLWKDRPHPLEKPLQNYLAVIGQMYAQQKEMFNERKNRVDHRIVSIHQPHVRPVVRGKARAKTEFGAKIHLSLLNGFSFLDTSSWDAFNETTHLADYVERYKARFGYYPERVLVDKIYLVLNLVNFTRVAPYCLILKDFQRFSMGARQFVVSIKVIVETFARKQIPSLQVVPILARF